MTTISSLVRPSGRVSLNVVRGAPDRLTLRTFVRDGFPHLGLSREVNLWRARNVAHLVAGLIPIATSWALGLPTVYGSAWAQVRRGDGTLVPLGLASVRLVTTAGVTFMAAKMGGTAPSGIANFLYHGFGTGATAEAVGNTALQTELTTEYAAANTRPTGNQAATGGVYTTVGTLTPGGSGTLAVTEHGVLDQASNAGGTLLDRSVFAAVNLTRGADSLQVTYAFTITAGG